MKHTAFIFALWLFLTPTLMRAETPIETVLNTFLLSAPTPTAIVVWSSSSGYVVKGGADGKPSLSFSGVANAGYKVFLDENEVPTLINGSFSLTLPIDQKSTKHQIRFIHPTENEYEIFFYARFFQDEKSDDHVELSWSKADFSFLPKGWYNHLRINLIVVKLGSSGTAFASQYGWAPNLLQISKTLSVRGNISAAFLTYVRNSTFLMLDSGILFSLNAEPWTFELGPSLQAWYGYHAHQPAFSANLLYGFEKNQLFIIHRVFAGYTLFWTRGIKAHEFKAGIEVVF